MTWGTSYFVSRAKAIKYYGSQTYADPAYTVHQKLKDGEIHIGVPHLRSDERLSIIDDGTRYAITDDKETR